MMKFDSFHTLQNLSHVVRGCQDNCPQVRTNISTRVDVSPKTGRDVVS